MNRLCAALPLLSLLGCSSPEKNPVTIEGRALDASGAAVGSAKAQVDRQVFVDGGISSNGYSSDDVVFAAQRQEPTLEDGRFIIDLHEGDAWSGPGAWRVTAPAAQGAVGPTFYFRPFASMKLAGLNAWVPKLSNAAADGGIATSVNPPPAVAVVAAKHVDQTPAPSQGTRVYRFELLSQGHVLWADWELDPSFTYPREALEDRTDVQVRVTTLSPALTADQSALLGIGQPSQSSYSVSYDAKLAGLEQGTLTPVSRGVPCTGILPAPATCPLTDGLLDDDSLYDHPLGLSGTDPNIVFTLRAPATLRTVVLRRLTVQSYPLTVEGSTDGTTWKPLGTVYAAAPAGGSTSEANKVFAALGDLDLSVLWTHADDGAEGSFLAVPLDVSQGPVTQVRLHFGTPSAYSYDSVSEVSFFE